MKLLDYNTLIALDESSIQASFPFGAIESKKGWRPAEEGEESRPLKQLLKDKAGRQEKPRLMPANSMRPPTDDPRMALGKRTARGSKQEWETDRGPEPEPERADEASEHRFGEDARARRNTQLGQGLMDRQARVIANKLVKIQREGSRYGVDVSSGLEQLIRATQREIAERRRKAA